MPEFVVSKDEDGLTVEQFLQQRIPSAPPGYLRQLLKKGKVKNGIQILREDTFVHLTTVLQEFGRAVNERIDVM